MTDMFMLPRGAARRPDPRPGSSEPAALWGFLGLAWAILLAALTCELFVPWVAGEIDDDEARVFGAQPEGTAHE